MTRIFSTLSVIAPLVVCMTIGFLARKTDAVTPEQNRGLQQFVLKFCIPCVLFNSCLEAQLESEALISMALLIPILLVCSIIGFRLRARQGGHNLPMLFSAHETGMLGIPLFMLLFGADQTYRMGLLDMTQAFVSIPVLSILSADTEKKSGAKALLKVFTSPLLIMSVLGFVLGLTGIMDKLDAIGLGKLIRETTSFMSQPVSAAMLFSIGYNLSLNRNNSRRIFALAGIHAALSAAACLIVQALLFLAPSVDAYTRWAVLLYFALPSSFLAPGLGRNEEELRLASGVCSVLTIVTIAVFCVMAFAAA